MGHWILHHRGVQDPHRMAECLHAYVAYWNHLQMSDGVHHRVSALEILSAAA